MNVAAAPAAPVAPIAIGTKIGVAAEIHFGVVQPLKPVFAGPLVGPETGWASLKDAVAGITELQPKPSSGLGGGSSTAIFNIDGRFVGQFIQRANGSDVRPWHIPTTFIQEDPRWVETVTGPRMPVPAS